MLYVLVHSILKMGYSQGVSKKRFLIIRVQDNLSWILSCVVNLATVSGDPSTRCDNIETPKPGDVHP